LAVVDRVRANLLACPGRRDCRPDVLAEREETRRDRMAWTRPKLREICIGMEINGYFAAIL
jgi:coenzyme PQQ precursor peptide PqqA